MKKVLIIEDDYFLGELYQDILTGGGYKVILSGDAQNGINQLDDNGADLILLDLMLPTHNGVEFLQELQSQSDWQNIPVIIISAAVKPSFNQQKFTQLGVRQFLSKTQITPEDLLSAVHKELKE